MQATTSRFVARRSLISPFSCLFSTFFCSLSDMCGKNSTVHLFYRFAPTVFFLCVLLFLSVRTNMDVCLWVKCAIPLCCTVTQLPGPRAGARVGHGHNHAPPLHDDDFGSDHAYAYAGYDGGVHSPYASRRRPPPPPPDYGYGRGYDYGSGAPPSSRAPPPPPPPPPSMGPRPPPPAPSPPTGDHSANSAKADAVISKAAKKVNPCRFP